MGKGLWLLLMLCLGQSAQAQIDWVEEDNGKWGFVDANGRWIVNPTYEGASWNSFAKVGTFVAHKTDTTVGVINDKGQVIIPQGTYDQVEMINYNFMRNVGPFYLRLHELDGKYGLAGVDGTLIIPCQFEDVKITEGGIIVSNQQGQNSAWSYQGKLLVPDTPMKITLEKDLVKVTNDNEECGAFSYEGEQVVPCEYKDVKKAADGIYIVEKADSKSNRSFFGYYAQGREIIPCIYDNVTPFVNDVATVRMNGEVRMLKNPLKDASQILTDDNLLANRKKGGPVLSRYPPPDSDVDKDIPVSKGKHEKLFAFIIANENYPKAPVPYALNDGRMFREYCQKTLGLPEANINLYEDATFGNIIQAVDKMKSVADAYEGEASIIFYYAGHGFPDEKRSTAYLLPIDGNASDITTTGYSLAKLYKELSGLKVKSSMVFLDACFSGAKREDQMLASGRGVAIKVKEEAPQGNMIVFSAAQGDETAHQLEEKHHGLFTYYLLKELQATGGDVDMGTLTDYVIRQVRRQSVVINNKKQTPTVIPSQSMVSSWLQMKLR